MTAEVSPPSPEERTSTRTEVITREPAEAMAGLLDIAMPSDEEVPPLWHWVYLVDHPPQASLGPDGHPVDGIPAPPGPGRRRMFAGGRLTTLHPLRFGAPATRTKRVVSSVEKQGSTGTLTFVTARTEISQDGRLAIVEENDIVYRTAASTLTALPSGTGAAVQGDLHLDVDPTLLFRFSALTYNAHRIHYDRDYAAEEGYPDLVVHGPLQVLMMGELLRRRPVDLIGRELSFRLVSPMIGPQRLTVAADPDGVSVRVMDGSGTVTATSALRDASAAP